MHTALAAAWIQFSKDWPIEAFDFVFVGAQAAMLLAVVGPVAGLAAELAVAAAVVVAIAAAALVAVVATVVAALVAVVAICKLAKDCLSGIDDGFALCLRDLFNLRLLAFIFILNTFLGTEFIFLFTKFGICSEFVRQIISNAIS